jgi:hypothetical protein
MALLLGMAISTSLNETPSDVPLGSTQLSGNPFGVLPFMYDVLTWILLAKHITWLQSWIERQDRQQACGCILSVYVLLWWALDGLMPVLVALFGWMLTVGFIIAFTSDYVVKQRLHAPEGATSGQVFALWAAAQAASLTRVDPKRVMGAVHIVTVWLCMWVHGHLFSTSGNSNCLVLAGICGTVLATSALCCRYPAITCQANRWGDALKSRLPAVLLKYESQRWSEMSGWLGAEAAVVLCVYAQYILHRHGLVVALSLQAVSYCVVFVVMGFRLDSMHFMIWATSASEALRRADMRLCKDLLLGGLLVSHGLLVCLASGPITALRLFTYLNVVQAYAPGSIRFLYDEVKIDM